MSYESEKTGKEEKMNRKVEGYNVDDSYRERFKKCLDYENDRREKVGEKKLNKSEFIVLILNYYYDNVVNESNRKRKEDKDAQYFASITKSLVEKYFNVLSDEMEFLAEKQTNLELYLKLLSDERNTLEDGNTADLSRRLSRLEVQDKAFRKIRSLYSTNRKNDLIDATEDDKKNDKDDDEGRQIF